MRSRALVRGRRRRARNERGTRSEEIIQHHLAIIWSAEQVGDAVTTRTTLRASQAKSERNSIDLRDESSRRRRFVRRLACWSIDDRTHRRSQRVPWASNARIQEDNWNSSKGKNEGRRSAPTPAKHCSNRFEHEATVRRGRAGSRTAAWRALPVASAVSRRVPGCGAHVLRASPPPRERGMP
ncbi:hypothetical protein OH77DRAFT_1309873 [Trametes cingulata]|nr:hypothetical protein OH77DRAFT_1309873 [Trametes cingulata]